MCSCCLKFRFYCLIFSTISNLNLTDFTTPNQSSVILILKIEMLLKFQNKRNSEIIGFYLIHFEFALELSDIDLWNIDLLNNHLDFLDTDVPSKYFVCLDSVLKTFSRCVFNTSSRQVFKTSSKHVFKASSRRLQDNNFSSAKTSSRCFGRCIQDVLL